MKQWEIDRYKRAIQSCKEKIKSHYEHTRNKVSNAIRNEYTKIKALEKQIPKKPKYYGDGYSDGKLVYDYAKCPVCGRDDFEYDINNWGCKYCPDCGQALDWGEN